MVEERGMRIEEEEVEEEKEEWGLWGMRREEEGRGGMVEEDKNE